MLFICLKGLSEVQFGLLLVANKLKVFFFFLFNHVFAKLCCQIRIFPMPKKSLNKVFNQVWEMNDMGACRAGHYSISCLRLIGTQSIYCRLNSSGEDKVNGPCFNTNHLKNDFF